MRAIFDRYKDFEIRLGRQAWGIKLEVKNAPASAFVDGSMIRGIKEHLFAVLRDIVYIHDAILGSQRFDLNDLGQHHQRGLSHPAQRADSRLQGPARPGGLLGRPFDQLGGVRLHQAGRLRARPARAQRVHGLRSGRDEGPDEGRHHRPFQAAYSRGALHRHDRAGHHRRRAAQSRSSISW